MNKKQQITAAIGFTAMAAGFAVKIIYPENVYNANNLKLADAFATILFVIGFSQLLLLKPLLRPGITIAVVTLASFLFEIRQYYSYGIADYLDVAASIAGGFISYFIWSRVNSINKSKN